MAPPVMQTRSNAARTRRESENPATGPVSAKGAVAEPNAVRSKVWLRTFGKRVDESNSEAGAKKSGNLAPKAPAVAKAPPKKATPQANAAKPPARVWRPSGRSNGLFEKPSTTFARPSLPQRRSSAAPSSSASGSVASSKQRTSLLTTSDPPEVAPAATGTVLPDHAPAADTDSENPNAISSTSDEHASVPDDNIVADFDNANPKATDSKSNVAATTTINGSSVADHVSAATGSISQTVTEISAGPAEANNGATGAGASRYVLQTQSGIGHPVGSSNGPDRYILTMTKELTEIGEQTLQVKVESWWDVDAQDRANPLAVTAYVDDIFTHYKNTEGEGMVDPGYMKHQTEISSHTRGVLLDWVVQVHKAYNLMPETLFLAINIFDRYLAVTNVPKKQLQLVGSACIMIAAKYEEIYAPLVAEFLDITENSYTRGQMLSMEKEILNKLSFKLSIPTCYVFAARFLKFATAAAAAADAVQAVSNGWSIEVSKGNTSRVHAFAWYLLELTISELSMIKFSPSHLAAAAVYTALVAAYQAGKAAKAGIPVSSQTVTCRRPTSEGELWGTGMAYLTGYEAEQLWPCAWLIVDLYHKASSSRRGAVYRKYLKPECAQAATYPAPLSQ